MSKTHVFRLWHGINRFGRSEECARSVEIHNIDIRSSCSYCAWDMRVDSTESRHLRMQAAKWFISIERKQEEKKPKGNIIRQTHCRGNVRSELDATGDRFDLQKSLEIWFLENMYFWKNQNQTREYVKFNRFNCPIRSDVRVWFTFHSQNHKWMAQVNARQTQWFALECSAFYNGPIVHRNRLGEWKKPPINNVFLFNYIGFN